MQRNWAFNTGKSGREGVFNKKGRRGRSIDGSLFFFLHDGQGQRIMYQPPLYKQFHPHCLFCLFCLFSFVCLFVCEIGAMRLGTYTRSIDQVVFLVLLPSIHLLITHPLLPCKDPSLALLSHIWCTTFTV